MKVLASTLLASALVLTACGTTSGAASEFDATTSASATTGAAREPVTPIVTLSATCESLYDGGAGSPLNSALALLTKADTAPSKVSNADEASASAAASALGKISSSADDLLAEQIDGVQVPLKAMAKGKEVDFTSGIADAEKLAATCSDYKPESIPSATLTPSSSTTAAPKPATTTPPAPKSTPSPTPSVNPTPDQVVTYILESDGTIEGAVYTTLLGAGGLSQEQDTNPHLGSVEKTYTFTHYQLNGGPYASHSLGVSGQAGPDATTITCRIILNGHVLKEQTSTGPYSTAMCNI